MEYSEAERRQRPRRAVRAAIAVAGVLTLLGVAAPAAADVSITPAEATQGGAADLKLLITNDSPTASITAVDLQLPSDTPIAEVYPMSVPDWAPAMTNAKIDKPIASLHGYQITEVTTAVKWFAMPDKALPPGGKTELYLSIGPLPAMAKLSFGVVLTNSDGTQVRWTGQPGASAAPGEHPAPVLVLKAVPAGQAAPGAHGAEHGGVTTGDTRAAADTGTDAPASGPSYGGWTLAVLLLIAAITVIGLMLQRRRGIDPPAEGAASSDAESPAESPDAESLDAESPIKSKSLAAAPSGPAP